MRVLVTGNFGFIGCHLVKALTKRGYEVIGVDIVPRSQVIDKAHFFKVDIRNYSKLSEVVKRVDLVVHLAALTDAYESLKKPEVYHDVNVSGTLNVLRLSHSLKIEKFVFISSAAVYGEACHLPIDEEHPLRPINPYGATKVACEAYVRAFHCSYNLPAVILRIFNVYGPGQKRTYAGVISEFVKRALLGKTLVIYGDGRQTRDFVYISDVIEAIIKALESDLDFGVFNIGTGKPVTINELAELIKNLTNRNELPITYEERRRGDVYQSYADVRRAKKILGWEAKVKLKEGLRKTIEWYMRTSRSSNSLLS